MARATDTLGALEKTTKASRRDRLGSRLFISIPALVTVVTLGLGIVCYEIVDIFLHDAVPADLMGRLTVSLLIAVLGGTFLAALAGLLLARTIIRPLRIMETRLGEMASTGRLESLADDGRLAPEIGRLGQRFDQVLSSLNAYVHQRNAYILECFTGGLVLLDNDGAVMTMNTGAETMLGPEARALTGKDFEKWLRATDGESQLAEAIALAMREGVFADSRELELATPSQGRFPIIVTITPIQGAEREKMGVAINFRDLRSYQQFSQHMDRADRLAAVGSFATGIAHEIRNPLGSVKGMAQLLAEDLAEGSPSREYADVIVREANRLDAVVRGLLDFAQPDAAPCEAADLNRLLAESLILSRNASDHEHLDRIEVVEDYAPIPPVWVQPDRVLQALVNLIRNAIEATPPGGRVRLSTRRTQTESAVPVCEARIANTGDPIPDEDIPRIFEPFFSTKHGGTGLGLPIVTQIVSTNGGRIHVEHAHGETVFFVHFPTHE